MSKKFGGPPGTKRIVSVSDVGADVPHEPKLAQATVKGPIVVPSSKKALRWASRKWSEAHISEHAAELGVSERRWALRAWKEFHGLLTEVAAPEVKEEVVPAPIIEPEARNDAMQAIVAGAKKKRDRKAQAPQTELTVADLSVDADAIVKTALSSFVDGPLRALVNAFATLYASRKTDGESDEAVAALDACRLVFDACGLILADVVVEAPPPAGNKEWQAVATPEVETVHVVETPEETPRDRKNRKDRERRAAIKERQAALVAGKASQKK